MYNLFDFLKLEQHMINMIKMSVLNRKKNHEKFTNAISL